MRSEKVRVLSAVDRRVLTHITEREARLMCGEDWYGNSLEGVEPTARRLSKKKEPLREIQLSYPLREEANSPCTLTKSDMVINADGAAHPELRKGPAGKTYDGQKLAMGNAIDRAMSKVEAWPETHDDRNVVICAGKVHGVTFIAPAQLAGL